MATCTIWGLSFGTCQIEKSYYVLIWATLCRVLDLLFKREGKRGGVREHKMLQNNNQRCRNKPDPAVKSHQNASLQLCEHKRGKQIILRLLWMTLFMNTPVYFYPGFFFKLANNEQYKSFSRNYFKEGGNIFGKITMNM